MEEAIAPLLINSLSISRIHASWTSYIPRGDRWPYWLVLIKFLIWKTTEVAYVKRSLTNTNSEAVNSVSLYKNLTHTVTNKLSMSLNIERRKTFYHGDGYHGDGYHSDGYHGDGYSAYHGDGYSGDGCPAPQLTNNDPLKDRRLQMLHTRFEND